MYKSIAILPIGPVNTKTGHNPMLGDIFAVWGPNTSFMVIQDINDTLRAVAGSGDVAGMQKQFPKDTYLRFHHDQTGKRIGNAESHKVLSHHPLTPEGLAAARALHNAPSFQTSTLK